MRTVPPAPSRVIPEGTADAALWSLGSTRAGLTSEDAAARLTRFGSNTIPDRARRALPIAFARELVHFMAILLWIAGALAFLAGMAELGCAIWAVVLLNGSFSFWQEYRAERALAEIAKVLPVRAQVLRDGERRVISAAELVPGDVMIVQEGDRISADARILEASGLKIDLSPMTGESEPASRDARPVARGAPLAEATNVLLAGCTVAAGHGRAVVFATGTESALGKLAAITATLQRGKSTLEIQVSRIVRAITVIALSMGVFVFAGAVFAAHMDERSAFLFAIGIIVANVPEGLLPTVTLSLAMCVQRMAKRNAIVRRLSAIETLSAATVVCSDKTGTLTTNHMTLRHLWVQGSGLEIGLGGELRRSNGSDGPELDREQRAAARALVIDGILCSNVHRAIPSQHQRARLTGDPIELALFEAARVFGVDPDAVRIEHPRSAEIPFDSRRRRMSVVVREPGGGRRAIVKGSPVELLATCTGIDGDRRTALRSEIERLAGEGCRVLAVATRIGGAELDTAAPSELESELTFAGVLAFVDPPRPEAAEAIHRCRSAGVRVVMVTGDHELTARAVARTIGLCTGREKLIAGVDLEQLDDRALDALLAQDDELIFARVQPEQKLRIVDAYKRNGHIVAVTGDGINDAPALRAADIGIAMGASGTDVARQAADIVLVDDNFATIVSAIEEGRAIYANIRKFMTYILSSNIPEIVPFIAMIAFDIPPALTVLQILAVDLGTDMLPALALGAEAPERGSMNQPPRSARERLLDWRVLARSYVFLGGLEAIASMGAFFLVFQRHGVSLADLRHATPALLAGAAEPAMTALFHQATGAALLAIIACQIGNVLNCRSARRPALEGGIFANHVLWVGIAVEVAIGVAIVSVGPAIELFATARLEGADWIYLAAWPFLMIAAEELRKLGARHGIIERRSPASPISPSSRSWRRRGSTSCPSASHRGSASADPLRRSSTRR